MKGLELHVQSRDALSVTTDASGKTLNRDTVTKLVVSAAR